MITQIEPWLDKDEFNELKDVIKNKWVTEGKKTELFESKIRELTKSKNAIAVCNGTMSLYICIKVLGIGLGDEVIVPDFTFIASANAVKMADATPIFVDVDDKTFNLDPKKIEEKITSKTKAIMPVHIYGQSADMEAIMEIAKKHNLYVIEDAAESIGAFFKGKHTGTFGHLGSLSFYGNKTITTGEGGVILTDDDELAKKVRIFKNHGRPKKGIFFHDYIGYNFAFTDLQAAIGLGQLKKFDKIVEKKTKNRELFMKYLKKVKDVQFTYMDPRGVPSHWFTNILVSNPQELQEFLEKNEIGSRRFFPPLHKQPCYSGLNIKDEFPNSDYAYDHGLSLPSSPLIKKKDIKIVCDKIREFYKK